jgi:membrane protein YdbS with pleckstrin-like domain
MTFKKINKILRIILGIDFFLILLSVILMSIDSLETSVKPVHVTLGIILLLLGLFHIISQHKLEKK